MWSAVLQGTQFPTVTHNTRTKTESPFPSEEAGLENFIRKEVSNMSLPRNQISEQPHTSLTAPQLDLNDLHQKILSLREQERREAEDKFQVALLLATTEKLCVTLTDFMTATQNELRKMNGEQLKTLNVQEQYREEIKAEVVKILNDVYGVIQKQQKTTLETMLAVVKASAESQEKKIKVCTQKCDEAITSVNASVNKLRNLKTLGDILFHLSPIMVIIDVILRIIYLVN